MFVELPHLFDLVNIYHGLLPLNLDSNLRVIQRFKKNGTIKLLKMTPLLQKIKEGRLLSQLLVQKLVRHNYL